MCPARGGAHAGYTFCQKILEQDINFEEKFFNNSNILLRNCPNFFVEHWTESQNQPYCFKSGKIYIFMGKITENYARKFQNLGAKFWKIGITWRRYWPKILKQVVTEIQKLKHPR